MELLLGPLGLLAGVLLVLMDAASEHPHWYPRSTYKAKCIELEKAEAANAEWKKRSERWEQLALLNSNLAVKAFDAAEKKAAT